MRIRHLVSTVLLVGGVIAGLSCTLDFSDFKSPTQTVETVECGDGIVSEGETCDPQHTDGCPQSVDDCGEGGNCIFYTFEGSADACTARCVSDSIDEPSGDVSDKCCPPDTVVEDDIDCTAVCGDMMVEGGETCDPPDSCEAEGTNCAPAEDECTIVTQINGSADACNLVCERDTIDTCNKSEGDGCCPSGCTVDTDIDCSICGNGILNEGEFCDPNEENGCPESRADCPANEGCIVYSFMGSVDNCTARCVSSRIQDVTGNLSDGCCPNGTPLEDDVDCSAECGDLVVEGGETCDPPSSCRDEGSSCAPVARQCFQLNEISGSAATCDLVCEQVAITACNNTVSDGCCPDICDDSNDLDCPFCGDGIVQDNETCDPNAAGSCPTLAECPAATEECQVAAVKGNATACTAACGFNEITTPNLEESDECCPDGATSADDIDCEEVTVCGDGIMEGDEKCDSGCTSASFEECKDCEESGDCANLCPTECPALQQISGTGCQTECVIGLGSSTL